MELHREVLSAQAAALFDTLRDSPELRGVTLMGGTGLALQIGHRISHDFDFASFTGTIPVRQIDSLIARLKQEGDSARLITSSDQVSRFKINTGLNLLDYARDYVINGVKVTFFAHGKTERQMAYYRTALKLPDTGAAFDIMGLDGLKVAKTLVLADRVRSRDLFDLMVLVRDHAYRMDELINVVRELGTIDDPEHYKAIMRGEVPLDADDEGLNPVNVHLGIDLIYAYFRRVLEEYEVEQARLFFGGG